MKTLIEIVAGFGLFEVLIVTGIACWARLDRTNPQEGEKPR